ncbi:unnamed protein product [Rhizophagus irregularis]|nr:unnamed protein product [Rhizophagus irregularis]
MFYGTYLSSAYYASQILPLVVSFLEFLEFCLLLSVCRLPEVRCRSLLVLLPNDLVRCDGESCRFQDSLYNFKAFQTLNRRKE